MPATLATPGVSLPAQFLAAGSALRTGGTANSGVRSDARATPRVPPYLRLLRESLSGVQLTDRPGDQLRFHPCTTGRGRRQMVTFGQDPATSFRLLQECS